MVSGLMRGEAGEVPSPYAAVGLLAERAGPSSGLSQGVRATPPSGH